MSVATPAVQGLTAEHVAALRRLCAQFQVALAVVFGSRAHGEAVATSDLDLLVLPSTATPFDLLGFEAAAQQIVGRPRVDVTVLQPALSSALAWEAIRDAIILWEDMPGTYEREKAIWRRRFVEDAPRRRLQALQLSRMFLMPLVPHIVRHDLQQLGEALARLERVSQGLSLAEYQADEVKRAACDGKAGHLKTCIVSG